MLLSCGRFQLDLGRPKIMAIVNVTDDSFSGDGCKAFDHALRAAERAVEQGADLIDVGGESSRPGAAGISEAEELERVVPVIAALQGLGVPLSVDTVKPRVMKEALDAGADLINDIAAFRQPGALEAVKDSSAALCVMHMQGEPRTMQIEPVYIDVVDEVRIFLDERVKALASTLKVQPTDVVGRVEALVEERRKLEKELADAKRKLAMGGGASGGADAPKQVNGISPLRKSVAYPLPKVALVMSLSEQLTINITGR